MPKPKRIFVIADLKSHQPSTLRYQVRMLLKGLTRGGHDVQCFSYPNVAMQYSPFRKKKWAIQYAKKKTDQTLTQQIKLYCPDLIVVAILKYLDHETLQQVRQAAPNTPIVGHDEDAMPGASPKRLRLAQQTDMMFCTGAGQFLQDYKQAGVPRVAFLPNMCDPDLQFRYPADDRFTADIIFSGKITHGSLGGAGDREKILQRLSKMPNGRTYGAFGTDWVHGLDYFRAISNAKIGLSTNYTNEVQMYHSDRLINYLACGTFVLAKRVPDTERLFEDKVHLRYFDTEEEFFDLAEGYLTHEDEREKIAAAGMAYAHSAYNCERMCGYLLDLAEGRDIDTPWKVIL
jgi:spore maturation protein CgeB